jgi:hypothetical protein
VERLVVVGKLVERIELERFVVVWPLVERFVLVGKLVERFVLVGKLVERIELEWLELERLELERKQLVGRIMARCKLGLTRSGRSR